MVCSMTAFSRAEQSFENGVLCWEIKTVNHRYLDVSFRLPEAFSFIEPALRTRVRQALCRGKVECQLKHSDRTTHQDSLSINESLVKDLLEAGSKLAATQLISNDLSVSTVLAWPGVIELNTSKVDNLAELTESLFDQALKELVKQRQTEGLALSGEVKARLTQLSEEIEASKQEIPVFNAQCREKLVARLNAFDLPLDKTRLEQELALLLARADVSEELDRLRIHASEVFKILERPEPAVGRRLDFLMQELHRETNTLSSKSNTIQLTQRAIDMKVLIEQMREQIQNIE